MQRNIFIWLTLFVFIHCAYTQQKEKNLEGLKKIEQPNRSIDHLLFDLPEIPDGFMEGFVMPAIELAELPEIDIDFEAMHEEMREVHVEMEQIHEEMREIHLEWDELHEEFLNIDVEPIIREALEQAESTLKNMPRHGRTKPLQ